MLNSYTHKYGILAIWSLWILPVSFSLNYWCTLWLYHTHLKGFSPAVYTFGFITMTGCRFAKSFFLFQLHFFTAKRESTKQIFATFFSDCVVGNGRHCWSRGVFTLYSLYCSLVDRSSPSIAATIVDQDVKVPRSFVTTTIVKRLEGSSFPRFCLTPIVAKKKFFSTRHCFVI